MKKSILTLLVRIIRDRSINSEPRFGTHMGSLMKSFRAKSWMIGMGVLICATPALAEPTAIDIQRMFINMSLAMARSEIPSIQTKTSKSEKCLEIGALRQTLSVPVVLTNPESPESLILAPSKEALATIQDVWRNSVIIEGYCGKTGNVDATGTRYIQEDDSAALAEKLKEISDQLDQLFQAFGLKVPPQTRISNLADKAQADSVLRSSSPLAPERQAIQGAAAQ